MIIKKPFESYFSFQTRYFLLVSTQRQKHFCPQAYRVPYAAFTLNDFDNQERNLTFVKTVFQVLKLKFLACSIKQAFYPFHKQNITRAWQ